MTKAIIALLLAALLVPIACVKSSATPTQTTPAPPLENTLWVLQSYGDPGKPTPAVTRVDSWSKDVKLTATFDPAMGQIGGFDGVNDYWAHYTTTDGKLEVSDVWQTAVLGPKALDDQEKEFVALLGKAESYKITGSQLRINCGQQVLIFGAQQ